MKAIALLLSALPLLLIACQSSSDLPNLLGPDEEITIAPEGQFMEAEAKLAMESATTHPITIEADLTPSRGSLIDAKYRYIPNFLQLGRQTIPNYLGTIQYIDGGYYTVAPSTRIYRYKGKFYLVPSDARFSTQYYGYFCGGGWGWGSGNNSKTPLPDGGLDAACRAHDQGWSATRGTVRQEAVRNADRQFLSALNAITSVWEYEADYVAAARTWIDCRVRNGVGTASWFARCGSRPVASLATGYISRLIRG